MNKTNCREGQRANALFPSPRSLLPARARPLEVGLRTSINRRRGGGRSHSPPRLLTDGGGAEEATAARDGDDPSEEGGEESESGELQEWGRGVGRLPRDTDRPRRVGQHRRPGANVTSSQSYLVTSNNLHDSSQQKTSSILQSRHRHGCQCRSVNDFLIISLIAYLVVSHFIISTRSGLPFMPILILDWFDRQ